MTNQESAPRRGDYSTQRLSQRYRFADPNMDLFFSALWAGDRREGYPSARHSTLLRKSSTATGTPGRTRSNIRAKC